MPRILPRLVQRLSAESRPFPVLPLPFTRKKAKSLFNERLPRPSFRANDRSILLAPRNPVTHSWDYIQRKRRPPHAELPEGIVEDTPDPPRRMSEQEKRWARDPYMKMLASSFRQCTVSNRVVPRDFLVRLVCLRMRRPVKGSSFDAALVPDGLLHPRYMPQKNGRAIYVACSRAATGMLHPGSFRRIASEIMLPKNLPDMVAHLLRLRVLQELDYLASRLEKQNRSLRSESPPLLRQLPYEEWLSLKNTDKLPRVDALAVIVAPSVNRDPKSKERPSINLSADPVSDEDVPRPNTVFPPFATLCNVYEPLGAPELLSARRVPLYHAIAAFPSRSQRHTLRTLLLRILKTQSEEARTSSRSPAFVLSPNSSLAAQVTSVAVALHRLHLFEKGNFL